MLRLENTNMILYNNNNEKWKNENKRKTQEIIWMYNNFYFSIKAKLRIIKWWGKVY